MTGKGPQDTREPKPVTRVSTVDIESLAVRVRSTLSKSASVVRLKARPVKLETNQEALWLWDLFLNHEPQPLLESCALACGIEILCACEQRTSELTQSASTALLCVREEHSGWTPWAEIDYGKLRWIEDPTTLDTYYAVTALLKTGHSTREPAIAEALEWLVSAANPRDGGWGYNRGEANSHLLATGYVVRLLNAVSGPDFRDVSQLLKSGEGFIHSCLDPASGGFGPKPGARATAAHTSLAILALVAIGASSKDKLISRAQQWLLENLDNQAGEVDDYSTRYRDKDRPGRDIKHVNIQGGLALQALVASGVDFLDRRFLGLVNELVESQDEGGVEKLDGTWEDRFWPHRKPIYAIMDRVLGMRMFLQTFERNRASIIARQGFMGDFRRGVGRYAWRPMARHKLISISAGVIAVVVAGGVVTYVYYGVPLSTDVIIIGVSGGIIGVIDAMVHFLERRGG